MELTGYRQQPDSTGLAKAQSEQEEQRLNAIFAALADPTRRAMLARLIDGEASVNELAAPFAISQPAVSKHLKVLELAGLVSRDIDRQRRPARLQPAAMAAAAVYLRSFWQGSFNQLDDLLDAMQSPGSIPFTDPNRQK